MRILKCTVLIISIIMYSCSTLSAQTEGQEKLLARRAALVEAYRNLAEKVYGLRIDSQTYVRDFIAESDHVRTDLDTFLKGAKISSATYFPDGICEVEVEMPIERIVVVLKRMKKQYAYAGRWRTIYFDKIREYYTDTYITAKGTGLPREEKESISSVTASIPGWENVTDRGRLMAERAALVDAYRNLGEIIMGLHIDSRTYVRDFVASSDQIKTDLDNWIKGVEPISSYRYLPSGICEVDVEVPVRQIVEQLIKIRKRIRYWHKVRYKTIALKRIIDYSPVEIIRATGAGVPPAKYIKSDTVSKETKKSIPNWASRGEIATGVGIPPEGTSDQEARLMAERAAKLDALRNLAEKVYGVKIDAVTTIRDFVTEHDEVRADVETFLNGAEVTDTRYLSDGSVEVDIAIALDGVWIIFEDHNL